MNPQIKEIASFILIVVVLVGVTHVYKAQQGKIAEESPRKNVQSEEEQLAILEMLRQQAKNEVSREDQLNALQALDEGEVESSVNTQSTHEDQLKALESLKNI